MQLTSLAFRQGGVIPEEYTCRGVNLSPPLAWSEEPPGTKSLALIAEDPDAPGGLFTHWTAWNIPAGREGLPSGLPMEGKTGDLHQGSNSFGQVGYGGPCPPRGHGAHRYFFRLFALDEALDLPLGASRPELEEAMKGHVLDEAELMGRYEIG